MVRWGIPDPDRAAVASALVGGNAVIVSTPQPNESAADLIDAFVHPPLVMPIDRRTERRGVIEVVSHAELWLWRCVVRGVFAHQSDGNDRAGTESAAGSEPDGVHSVDDLPEQVAWMDDWAITDDLGTVYRRVSGGGVGRPVTWSDFSIEFHPGVPMNARRLTITTATDPIVVDIEREG